LLADPTYTIDPSIWKPAVIPCKNKVFRPSVVSEYDDVCSKINHYSQTKYFKKEISNSIPQLYGLKEHPRTSKLNVGSSFTT
jgi:hypothetical protein